MKPLLTLPLLAGCALTAAQLDPPLAQLVRWQTATPGALAEEPVLAPCPAENPACATLHLLRGQACLSLATAARAPGAACPGPAQAARLACAAEGYTNALALGAQPAATLAENAALALLCRAELLPAPEALPLARRAATLAAQAEAARATALTRWSTQLQQRLAP